MNPPPGRDHDDMTLGMRIDWPGAIHVRLWTDLVAERERAAAADRAKRAAVRADLEGQKAALLDRRRRLASLREQLAEARELVEHGDGSATAPMIAAMLRESDLAPIRDQPLAAACFYLYKDKDLTGRMLEVAATAVADLPFTEDHLALYYDVAVLHQEAGDPAIAREILGRFIDDLHLTYRDVAERSTRLGRGDR